LTQNTVYYVPVLGSGPDWSRPDFSRCLCASVICRKIRWKSWLE